MRSGVPAKLSSFFPPGHSVSISHRNSLQCYILVVQDLLSWSIHDASWISRRMARSLVGECEGKKGNARCQVGTVEEVEAGVRKSAMIIKAHSGTSGTAHDGYTY